MANRMLDGVKDRLRREGKEVLSDKTKKGRYCLNCHEVYKVAAFGQEVDRCPTCKDKILQQYTVFDRDSGIGEIPVNLRKYLSR